MIEAMHTAKDILPDLNRFSILAVELSKEKNVS
jgi:hypothetical protein